MLDHTDVTVSRDLLPRARTDQDVTGVSIGQLSEVEDAWFEWATKIEAGEDAFGSSHLAFESARTLTGKEIRDLMSEFAKYVAKQLPVQPAPISAAVNEGGRASNDRLVLLARKYAQKRFPMEDEARLMLLTEKLRRMVPRVTEDDLDKLSEIASFLESLD